MALKPEMSLVVAAATGVLVYGIFVVELPSAADVHAATPYNAHVGGSITVAGWTAAAAVAGISLLAKDPTVFVVGGSLAAFLTWRYKHANSVNPATGEVVMPPQNPGPSPAMGQGVPS